MLNLLKVGRGRDAQLLPCVLYGDDVPSLRSQHANGVLKQSRHVIKAPNSADLSASAADPVAEGTVQHSHTPLQPGQKCSHAVPQGGGTFQFVEKQLEVKHFLPNTSDAMHF